MMKPKSAHKFVGRGVHMTLDRHVLDPVYLDPNKQNLKPPEHVLYWLEEVITKEH